MSGCSYVPWREQGWVGFFVVGCALHTSRALAALLGLRSAHLPHARHAARAAPLHTSRTLAALLELRSALNVNRYTHERSLCPL